jgi:hypothetical protein
MASSSLVTTYLTQLMMQPCKTLFINTPKIGKIWENIQRNFFFKKEKFTGHHVSLNLMSKSLHVKIGKMYTKEKKKKGKIYRTSS